MGTRTQVWAVLSDIKQSRLDFAQFMAICPDDIAFTFVDPTLPEQLSLMYEGIRASSPTTRHVVLHKLSDFVKTSVTDSLSDLVALFSCTIARIQQDLPAAHLVLINSLQSMSVLPDRWRTIQFTREELSSMIRTPPSRLEWDEETLEFPLLWKPISACGDPASHTMQYLPDAAALASLPKEGLLQQFVPHRGVLFKVYVVGKRIHIDARPSLVASRQAHTFDPQYMRGLDPLNQLDAKWATEQSSRHARLIQDVSKRIRDALGLDLFGWDLIVGEADGMPYIIDINCFPKFSGFKDFHRHLKNLIMGISE